MTSILAFFILICVLVFVHEYGHFWAARRCGVKVLRFSIGFGKVLWRKTDKHGTEFAFSLIPLGGYVQMYNGEPEHHLPPTQALESKTVLQRIFIVLAGPMANFLFAIVAYWIVFMVGIPTLKPVIGAVIPDTPAARAGLVAELDIHQVDGRSVKTWEDATLALVGKVGARDVALSGKLIDEDLMRHFSLDLSYWQIDGNRENPLTGLGIRPKSGVIEPIIKAVVEQSPAEKAGLQVNDHILSINQQPFDWQFLVEQVKTGLPIALEIERRGEQHRIQVLPEKLANQPHYQIGVVPSYQPLSDKYRTELKYDMLSALSQSFDKVGSLIKTVIQFIGNLFSGDLSLKNMGGPISMAKGAGTTLEIGLVYYLSFMALISVNLGVINLLPILPLDGGRLLVLTAEGLRGKALPEKWQLSFQQLGLVFVLGLMAFAFLNDLIHF